MRETSLFHSKKLKAQFDDSNFSISDVFYQKNLLLVDGISLDQQCTFIYKLYVFRELHGRQVRKQVLVNNAPFFYSQNRKLLLIKKGQRLKIYKLTEDQYAPIVTYENIHFCDFLDPSGKFLLLNRVVGRGDIERDICHIRNNDIERSPVSDPKLIKKFLGLFVKNRKNLNQVIQRLPSFDRKDLPLFQSVYSGILVAIRKYQGGQSLVNFLIAIRLICGLLKPGFAEIQGHIDQLLCDNVDHLEYVFNCFKSVGPEINISNIQEDELVDKDDMDLVLSYLVTDIVERERILEYLRKGETIDSLFERVNKANYKEKPYLSFLFLKFRKDITACSTDYDKFISITAIPIRKILLHKPREAAVIQNFIIEHLIRRPTQKLVHSKI